MPKFAANLTFLFKEYPFLERFAAAADAGFQGIEVLFPYDDAASEIVSRLQKANLPLVLINTPPPNWAGGARGFAAIPGGEARFQTDFKRALRFAQRLKPMHIHIMAGNTDGPQARETFVRNLTWATETAPKQSLTIEPINQTDMPGYYLSDFDLAADIIAEVDAPNLHLQYDAYHAQMITGDAMAVWDNHKDLVRHIQVGGLPGRHEPVKADFDYPAFFALLDEQGYKGFVSGEYNPTGRTADGLDWIKQQSDGAK